MTGPLVIDRHVIEALCLKYAVRRLLLFGSAGTDSFDEATSDIDFLVEFDDALVWEVASTRVPELTAVLARLLDGA